MQGGPVAEAGCAPKPRPLFGRGRAAVRREGIPPILGVRFGAFFFFALQRSNFPYGAFLLRSFGLFVATL